MEDIVRAVRPITLDNAIKDYQAFERMTVTELSRQRYGLRALDYFFFFYRLQTKNKNKKKTYGHTFFEAYEHERENLLRIARRLQRGEDMPSLFAAYELAYGTVNQFRPAIASYLYQRYKPTAILDFSAGWGGRCLAAMALDIPYIGIDSNVALQQPYSNMITALDRSANVQLYFQPAEMFDYTAVEYDMICTSPPYFMLEKYQNMPEYESKEDFLTRFFVPVVMTAWHYLTVGGYMLLNMPEEMYDCLSGLGPAVEVLEMPITKRPGCIKTIGEQIYVWHKGS